MKDHFLGLKIFEDIPEGFRLKDTVEVKTKEILELIADYKKAATNQCKCGGSCNCNN